MNSPINPSVNVRNNIQVGAIGLAIHYEVREGYNVLNVSSASAITVYIERPDHTLVTSSGSFLTDGTDGIIVYNTTGTDISQDGDYKTQLYFEIPTFKGRTTVTTFHVYPNLPY